MFFTTFTHLFIGMTGLALNVFSESKNVKIFVQVLLSLFILSGFPPFLQQCSAQQFDKFAYRPYETYGIDQQRIDKWIVRNYYTKQLHLIDSAYIAKTDTSIECESIEFFIAKTSVFSPLFTKGVISCNKLNQMFTNLPCWKIDFAQYDVPGSQRKPKIDLRGVQLLDFISTKKNQRFLKFRMYKSIFYVELTNEKANKHTPLQDFIKNASLTWLYKSPQYVPNM